MQVRVSYRIDAHHYDRRRAGCRPRCPACRLEAATYRSVDDALAAQPREELALGEGDQAALIPPPRRFQVVVVDFFA